MKPIVRILLISMSFAAHPQVLHKNPKPFVTAGIDTAGSLTLVATCPKGYWIEWGYGTHRDYVMHGTINSSLSAWKKRMKAGKCTLISADGGKK